MPSFYGCDPIDGVACPLCLATAGRVLYTVTAEQSATAFVRSAHDPETHRKLVLIIRELWGTAECRQVRCETCRCVYAWPHRSGDARFYNLAFQEHMNYPQNRWEFYAAARFLEPESSGPILELGAGDGAFVRILRSRGVSASSISVVEYSDDARKHLASIDSSLKVFSDLDQFLDTTEPHRCSHAFAFQVMEHLQNPLDYLHQFRRALRPGGCLCLAVPNAGRIEANEHNGLLLDMPPCHITRFTIDGIAGLAKRAGFELIHHEIEPLVYRDWFREFLAYRFKQRLQSDGSVENWMERTLPWQLARMGGALLAMPAAIAHSMERKEGGSLFFVLREG